MQINIKQQKKKKSSRLIKPKRRLMPSTHRRALQIDKYKHEDVEKESSCNHNKER
jgi:hypothetical protein